MGDKGRTSYDAKLRQCDREALITAGALVLTIIVWIICGFGLAGSTVRILGIPLWAVCGTVGTWIFSIIVAVALSKRFFQDFDPAEGDEG